jgi:hypothetical protein
MAAYLGCLRAGCACGRETWPDQGLLWNLSADLPDLYGLRAPRGAVQVLGVGWGAFMLGLTLWAARRGGASALWLFLYGIGDFTLGFLRGDTTPVVGSLSALQVAGLGIALAGAVLGMISRGVSGRD